MTRILSFLKHNAIALAALFVALGGTSYAAMAIPRNSVGAHQLRRGAVTSTKIHSGAITPGKLASKSFGGRIFAVTEMATNGAVMASDPKGVKVDSVDRRQWRDRHVPASLPEGLLAGGCAGGARQSQSRGDHPTSVPAAPASTLCRSPRMGRCSSLSDRLPPLMTVWRHRVTLSSRLTRVLAVVVLLVLGLISVMPAHADEAVNADCGIYANGIFAPTPATSLPTQQNCGSAGGQPNDLHHRDIDRRRSRLLVRERASRAADRRSDDRGDG